MNDLLRAYIASARVGDQDNMSDQLCRTTPGYNCHNCYFEEEEELANLGRCWHSHRTLLTKNFLFD